MLVVWLFSILLQVATCIGVNVIKQDENVNTSKAFVIRKENKLTSHIRSAVNVAFRRPTWQSSTYEYRFTSDLAVDGIRDTNIKYCTHTNRDANPWWAVDLGEPKNVRGVSFLNRGDCCAERATNFIVGLTNISVHSQTPVPWKYAICGRYPGSVAAGHSAHVECVPYSPAARYVIVQLERTDALTICELEVYARDSSRPVPPPGIPKICPSSFTYLESVRGCYHVVFENLEWEIAGLRCKRLHKDAHLIVINNHAEQAAVANMMESHPASSFSSCVNYGSGNPAGTPFWTAGQRIDPTRNSPFVWNIKNVDSGGCDVKSEMAYTAWAHGEPSGGQGGGESCVQMARGRGYAWNDGACTRSFCSICEIDI